MELTLGSVKPTRDLPASYTEVWGFDLMKNHKAALVLNIAAFPLFFLFGWLFVEIASFIRAGVATGLHLGTLATQPLLFFLVFSTVVAGTMILHEAIHGVFFWLFTKSKPVFGLKLLFAYAGAPEWYLPRNQYAFIGIAPFLFITLLGFFLIVFVSLPACQLALFAIVMNAAGAVGDFYVTGKVMCQSRDVLIRDTGVGFTMFAKLGSTTEIPQKTGKGNVGHER